MIELNSKQKSQLRGVAQRIKSSVSVGKAGLSDAMSANLSRLLEQHELVKVSIPAGSGAERQELAEALAAATQSALVGMLGRTVVLYRPNEQLPPERRIELE